MVWQWAPEITQNRYLILHQSCLSNLKEVKLRRTYTYYCFRLNLWGRQKKAIKSYHLPGGCHSSILLDPAQSKVQFSSIKVCPAVIIAYR